MASQKSFNADDIPDLSNKTILVTGGNSGLGAESCLQFARHGSPRIFLGARSREKADQAIADIKKQVPNANITFLSMDLQDLASVKKAAEEFLAASDRLDILLNNAGIMACPAGLTKDGFEVQFGTNHMGHALLTKMLLPVLQKTAEQPGSDTRIVNVSSRAHKRAPPQGLVLDAATTPMSDVSTWTRYGQSKIANVYFTQELAKRYPSIKCITLHPGVVSTNLLRGPGDSYSWVPGFIWSAAKMMFVTVQQGALNQLWASTSPDAKSGEYYDPVGKSGSVSELVKDKSMAPKLWDWTESQLREKGF